MRFLGIGDSCDLGALYHRLVEAGHEVRVSIADPLARGTLKGIVEQTSDWRAELAWIRAAGRDGVILFENVADARGALQDELRADGFQVIGGSAYGDRLENDRAYAQKVLAEVGLPTAGMREFDDPAAADAFLAANPGRYVLKFNGPGYAASDNYVGQLADGRDVRALLKAKLRQRGTALTSFVIMDYLEGVEMGVGAYFDGQDFLSPPCLDWEHKRFFTGDMGELTGEMGTVVAFDRSRRFFELTLARVAPYLRRHGYCGYINLNTIVNERGIWPLEFCCRFTYPGFALLDALQETPWADIFRMMLKGGAAEPFAVRPGFCVAIVLTTPPFPYTVKQVSEPIGLPVLFDRPLTAKDRANIHYGEVGLEDGQLVTSGLYGWTMVVTAVASTIGGANGEACRLAERVLVPNLRYRRDIGDRLIGGEYARLEELGLLDD